MQKMLLVSGICSLIIACASPNAPRYAISMDNSLALKKYEGSKALISGLKSNVRYNPACRMVGSVNPPDGMSMPQFIEKALNDELKNGGIYDSSGIPLSGVLTKIGFSSTSSVTRGWWDMGLKLSSPKGETLYIENTYEFESGFEGMTACYQVSQALTPAVQDLIHKIITAPAFSALLK